MQITNKFKGLVLKIFIYTSTTPWLSIFIFNMIDMIKYSLFVFYLLAYVTSKSQERLIWLHELLMSLVEVQKLLINHFPENFCTFRTYLLSLSKQLSSGLIKMISTHLEMWCTYNNWLHTAELMLGKKNCLVGIAILLSHLTDTEENVS